jgi:hypothetical protein
MRALPRTKASPAFTSSVLRAVRTVAPRTVALPWRVAAAFAMVVCLVVAVQVVAIQHQRAERMAALRIEQQKIEAELQAVKRQAADTEPVVVLEHDNGTRVIMDLDSAIQPASLKTYD